MLEPGTPGPFDFRSQRSRSAETTPQPFTSETLPHLRLAGHHQDYTLKALLAAGSPVLQEDAISRACFVAAARDKLFSGKTLHSDVVYSRERAIYEIRDESRVVHRYPLFPIGSLVLRDDNSYSFVSIEADPIRKTLPTHVLDYLESLRAKARALHLPELEAFEGEGTWKPRSRYTSWRFLALANELEERPSTVVRYKQSLSGNVCRLHYGIALVAPDEVELQTDDGENAIKNFFHDFGPALLHSHRSLVGDPIGAFASLAEECGLFARRFPNGELLVASRSPFQNGHSEHSALLIREVKEVGQKKCVALEPIAPGSDDARKVCEIVREEDV
ncbi:MAG: hypothetical protein KDD64_05345 [Bdellovibrionales bacterium]|nr:hypothetical protein [Bdellovibrionales bacterium]